MQVFVNVSRILKHNSRLDSNEKQPRKGRDVMNIGQWILPDGIRRNTYSMAVIYEIKRKSRTFVGNTIIAARKTDERRCSVVVSMSAWHTAGRGSIPARTRRVALGIDSLYKPGT